MILYFEDDINSTIMSDRPKLIVTVAFAALVGLAIGFVLYQFVLQIIREFAEN